MQWKSPPRCELCQGKLVGAAEINSIVEGDTVVLTIRESLLVDWTCCPVCKAIVCKACCVDRRSGYCRACAHDAEMRQFNLTGGNVSSGAPDDDILSADIIF